MLQNVSRRTALNYRNFLQPLLSATLEKPLYPPKSQFKPHIPNKKHNSLVTHSAPKTSIISKSSHICHNPIRKQYIKSVADVIRGTNTKRGDLQINILRAKELRSKCNFATISIAGFTLKTNHVSSDKNPIWNETLIFSNYRPQIDKKAIISIGNKSKIFGESEIGFAEFELPIIFDTKEPLAMLIYNKKNKLCR
eukprot:820183_1